jgi:DNA-binding beta-propeller fold protein YncE
MNDHLSRQQLISYVYQALTDSQRERVELHLTMCSDCQARLAEQEALHQRINTGVLALQRQVTPPAQMNFTNIAPRLKRSRARPIMTQSRQLLYSALTLAVLIVFGVGLYTLFSNINPPTIKPTPDLSTPPAIATLDPTQPPEFVWKISGDPNPLAGPSGLGLDAEGNIYVVDTGNNRIQKFDGEGQFLMVWGSPGSGEGQFNFTPPRKVHAGPGDVAVDSQGNIYVADSGNVRIQKFDQEGRFLTQWDSSSGGEGQFQFPFGLAIDGQDNVYVVDGTPHLQKFDGEGQFLAKWGDIGVRDGEFATIGFAAVDVQGNIYVADRGAGRIQKFNSSGQFLGKWGSVGMGDGQFVGANGIAVDGQGYIYVTDFGNPRVQIFDSQGKFLLKWGSRGQDDGQFTNPTDIVVDGQGNIYVSDYNNNTIQKFRR